MQVNVRAMAPTRPGQKIPTSTLTGYRGECLKRFITEGGSSFHRDIAGKWQSVSDATSFALHAETRSAPSGTITLLVAGETAVRVNGRTVCNRGAYSACQGHTESCCARLTFVGDRYDVTVNRG